LGKSKGKKKEKTKVRMGGGETLGEHLHSPFKGIGITEKRNLQKAKKTKKQPRRRKGRDEMKRGRRGEVGKTSIEGTGWTDVRHTRLAGEGKKGGTPKTTTAIEGES